VTGQHTNLVYVVMLVVSIFVMFRKPTKVIPPRPSSAINLEKAGTDRLLSSTEDNSNLSIPKLDKTGSTLHFLTLLFFVDVFIKSPQLFAAANIIIYIFVK